MTTAAKKPAAPPPSPSEAIASALDLLEAVADPHALSRCGTCGSPTASRPGAPCPSCERGFGLPEAFAEVGDALSRAAEAAEELEADAADAAEGRASAEARVAELEAELDKAQIALDSLEGSLQRFAPHQQGECPSCGAPSAVSPHALGCPESRPLGRPRGDLPGLLYDRTLALVASSVAKALADRPAAPPPDSSPALAEALSSLVESRRRESEAVQAREALGLRLSAVERELLGSMRELVDLRRSVRRTPPPPPSAPTPRPPAPPAPTPRPLPSSQTSAPPQAVRTPAPPAPRPSPSSQAPAPRPAPAAKAPPATVRGLLKALAPAFAAAGAPSSFLWKQGAFRVAPAGPSGLLVWGPGLRAAASLPGGGAPPPFPAEAPPRSCAAWEFLALLKALPPASPLGLVEPAADGFRLAGAFVRTFSADAPAFPSPTFAPGAPAVPVGEAFGFVLSAASPDPTREHIQALGVCGGGSIVATDGHRLHASGPVGPVEWVIPRPIADAASAAAGPATAFPIRQGDEKALWSAVEAPGLRLEAKVDRGLALPPCDRVVPADSDAALVARLDAGALRRALTEARLWLKGTTRGVVVSQSPGGLLLTADDPDKGVRSWALEPISAEGSLPEPAGFKPGYVLDAIDGASGAVELRLGAGLSPAKVVRGDGLVAVVMPMRI